MSLYGHPDLLRSVTNPQRNLRAKLGDWSRSDNARFLWPHQWAPRSLSPGTAINREGYFVVRATRCPTFFRDLMSYDAHECILEQMIWHQKKSTRLFRQSLIVSALLSSKCFFNNYIYRTDFYLFVSGWHVCVSTL